jgi:hypothetical protein
MEMASRRVSVLPSPSEMADSSIVVNRSEQSPDAQTHAVTEFIGPLARASFGVDGWFAS